MMHMEKTGIAIWLVICTVFAINASAQPRYNAEIPPVNSKNFYTIDLPVGVVGKAKSDLSDLRIIDTNGKEIPFIIKKDIRTNNRDEFIPYRIVVKAEVNRHTDIEIETQGEKVSSFILNIKNTDTQKQAILKGSNDRNRWYTVKEDLLLSEIYNQNTTNTLLKLHFPLSDYKYYLLSINDSLFAPLNIIEIGKMDYRSEVQYNRLKIPHRELYTENKDGNTYITIRFNDKYNLSDILFYISEPQFYNRPITLSVPQEERRMPQVRQNRKRKKEPAPAEARYYTLNSNNQDSHTIRYNEYTDVLHIMIRNHDNLPLKIDSIITYCDKYYLVAWLNDSVLYRLTYGDTQASMPVYDLAFFENNISATTDHLTLKAIKSVQNEAGTPKSPWTSLFKIYGIWVIIVIVISQIMYLVWKMTRKKNI